MDTDQFSQSAAFIAVKLYGLTRSDQYRSLFDEETVLFYENIVCRLPRPIRYYHCWLKFKSVRWLYIRSEELLLPGDLMHILARKWYINKMIDDFREKGYEQVLVLGGGFDHQSFRLTRLGLRTLEVDSPHMANLKEEFLNVCYPREKHPQIIPMHLPEHSLAEILQHQKELARDKKTIIIAEGFFDYLHAQIVGTVLDTLRNYFDQPALVSTHFSLDELSPFHRTVFMMSLRMVDERLQLNASMAEFENMLSQHGFLIRQTVNTNQVEKTLLSELDTNLPMLKGFYLVSAG